MKKIQPGDLMIKKFKSIQSVIFAVLSVLLLGAVGIVTVISLIPGSRYLKISLCTRRLLSSR